MGPRLGRLPLLVTREQSPPCCCSHCARDRHSRRGMEEACPTFMWDRSVCCLAMRGSRWTEHERPEHGQSACVLAEMLGGLSGDAAIPPPRPR